MKPNYRQIYIDLLIMKHPHKINECIDFLIKNKWDCLDVITFNKLIFNSNGVDLKRKDGKFRSYDRNTMIKILKFKHEKGWNNSQLALHFNISRTTIRAWEKKLE